MTFAVDEDDEMLLKVGRQIDGPVEAHPEVFVEMQRPRLTKRWSIPKADGGVAGERNDGVDTHFHHRHLKGKRHGLLPNDAHFHHRHLKEKKTWINTE